MSSIGIVGAGITGLTAAFRLRQAGHDAQVYEAGGRPGGVVQTIARDGYRAECGPNTLMETSPVIGELIHALGLDERRLYSRPEAEKRFLVRHRQLVALPSSPPAFFASPLFSTRAKLHLLREPFVRRAPADLEESVGQFVARRLGREFLDYAINPMVAGIYAGDPWRLSVRHAFPRLHQVEREYGSLILGQILGARKRKRRGEISKQNARKLSFDSGLAVLTDTLASRVSSVHLHAPVSEIGATGGRWKVSFRDGTRPAGTHDALLLAAPAHQLAGLRLGASATAFATLGEVPYPPVASIALGFERARVKHALDGFGVLIPEVEGFHLLGTLFSSTLFPHRAPDGHVLLTSYIGGMRSPESALLEDDRLVALACADLKILLGVESLPTFVHIARYPKAIPQYEVGFGRFKEYMDQLERDHPGLFLAGHYRDGISLSDSLVAGWNVAEKIMRHFARHPAAGAKPTPLRESVAAG